MFRAIDHAAVFNQLSDHPRSFPRKALKLLKDLNLLEVSIPEKYRNKILHVKKPAQSLYELLFELGRADLSVGRIYEGHKNALLLIETYGTSKQKTKYFCEAAEGKIFGVWNTESAFEGLKIQNNKEVIILNGAKTFCTGALNIHHPIVTAKTSSGTQMIVLDINEQLGLVEDWSLWNPSGMRASVSCRIDFTGLSISQEQFLGGIDDYSKEPLFNWGAVRFSAVQLGGAQAIADIMLSHLQKHNRTSDPYQKMRLGKIAVLIETAKLWIRKANKIRNSSKESYALEKKVCFAHMMRTLTTDICEEIITLAEKSIGINGMMESHPLEKPVRDLRFYLKQAGPDAALASIGNYLANNDIEKCPSKII